MRYDWLYWICIYCISVRESLRKYCCIYFNFLRNKGVEYFVMVSESYPVTPNILNHG